MKSNRAHAVYDIAYGFSSPSLELEAWRVESARREYSSSNSELDSRLDDFDVVLDAYSRVYVSLASFCLFP